MHFLINSSNTHQPVAISNTHALISVFNKSGIDKVALQLQKSGYQILSTGGTATHLQKSGCKVQQVEDLTHYPSILGGRVKTLHPLVFGGILGRTDVESDCREMEQHHIPTINIVIVDLYPFQETLQQEAEHQDIIEKIDIGGISLLRAAAKNYQRTWVISSQNQYDEVLEIMEKGGPSEEERRQFAAKAFHTCYEYDMAIQGYLAQEPAPAISLGTANPLRYGENPHQKGVFYGNLNEVFEKLHGKELSYNNLLDCDAALQLMAEFNETTVAVIKHNNACGLASRDNLAQAWHDALAGDPVSAFGGVISMNRPLDATTAEAIDKIFFEVILAPDYELEALKVLQRKKKRVILKYKPFGKSKVQYRSLLNGYLAQDYNRATDAPTAQDCVTQNPATEAQMEDLAFASKIAKHTKSNTIVLAKNKQLLGSGTGQTSRVDALHQAIDKARRFELSLQGAVMASDAFFPFPDCVEIAHKAGIKAVIQPGGSIRDQESTEYCNQNQMSMLCTGTRHFKH